MRTLLNVLNSYVHGFEMNITLLIKKNVVIGYLSVNRKYTTFYCPWQ